MWYTCRCYGLAVSGAGGGDTGLNRRESIGSSVGLGIWWAGKEGSGCDSGDLDR